MQRKGLFVKTLIVRHFCVSCIKNAPSYANRQSRFMKKLMQGSQPKRKWYKNDLVPKILPDEGDKPIPFHTARRMTMLNKIFMEHITDMMSTGEISPFFLKRNIEITHVKVANDFKVLNVFWMVTDNDFENYAVQTKDILQQCALRLRHELSQLRVIGRVPPIQFVEYKKVAVEREIEKRLKIADYGEEFEEHMYPFSPTSVISYKSDSTEDSINDVENSESSEDFCITLPIMRNDVFGLDHHRIMSKIKTSLNNVKEAATKRASDLITVSHDSSILTTQSIPNFVTDKEQQEEFSKFIMKREKDERRRYKLENPKVHTNDIIRLMKEGDNDFDDIEQNIDDHKDEYEEYEEDE